MSGATPSRTWLRWLTPWPLSALEVWVLAWVVHQLLQPWGPIGAWLAAAGVGAALALMFAARWRRLIVALGFPVSVLALGSQGALPAWLWLLPLALLWWLYPRRSWSEAPLFPTPAGALQPLPGHAPLAPGARVLDAGCGVGDGLRELVRAYPQAAVEGVEWSRPLAWLARLRVRQARVRQGDLWADDWGAFALVYVFQRPESMPRVWAKACAEMPPDRWLVSLDFAVPEVEAVVSWALPSGQLVRVYRPVRNAAAMPPK
ncbi:class I SAM-dependent methyltransferase [Roseateles sp. BYS87W]|uniref:Class I SAM-dependent methyltransferase n=1 Tax=Pelomonas baiyunensis TaxID=3299026 RepID=A0ABW7GUD7_9BURK